MNNGIKIIIVLRLLPQLQMMCEPQLHTKEDGLLNGNIIAHYYFIYVFHLYSKTFFLLRKQLKEKGIEIVQK